MLEAWALEAKLQKAEESQMAAGFDASALQLQSTHEQSYFRPVRKHDRHNQHDN